MHVNDLRTVPVGDTFLLHSLFRFLLFPADRADVSLFFFTSYISLSMAQVHGYKTKVELWSISRRYVVDTICFCLIFIFIFLFFYFFYFFSLLVQHNYRKRKMENGRVI